MKCYTQNRRIFNTKILLAVVAVFVTAVALLTATNDACVAYADDAFGVLFPTNNYFQSPSPALVSANRNYLVIYDDSTRTLFARADEEWTYSLDFENVEGIFVIEDEVFLHADDKYYTLSLASRTSVPQERVIPTPSDVTFFNSDGTYLYAHSAAGRITVYDKNLDVALGIDNLYDPDVLAGKIVVAGEGSNLIVFSTEYASPVFVTYNAVTHEKTIKGITHHIGEAYVGDVVYALEIIQQSTAQDAQKRIVCIDKTSGELLFATDINPDKYFAFGNRLFTIQDGGVTVYALNDEHTALTKTQSITMSGSDLLHLDKPSDVVRAQDETVIADKQNNRVLFVGSSGVATALSLSEKPLALCNDSSSVYVALGDTVVQIRDKQIWQTYPLQNVKDVAYLDSLYALTDDGIYVLIGANFVKAFDVENAKRISCAKDGTNLHVLTDEAVLSFNRAGKQLPALAHGDFSQATDFAVDYTGKAFVAYTDKIDWYLDNACGSVALSHPSFKATVSSVCLDGASLLFSADECFVGIIGVDATTKQSFDAQPPVIVKGDYFFATKSNDDALFFSADGRMENVTIADEQTVIVYTGQSTADGKTYARVGDKLVAVNPEHFTRKSQTALEGDYVVKSDVTLYALPYVEDGKIAVGQGTRVSLAKDAVDYDWSGWVVVSYGGNEYFARVGDVEQYVEIVDEKDKIYGKANADRVGGLVNVYADLSTSSEVIAQIVDGRKVEVLQTFDDFYLVSFDGMQGYVLKSQLKIGALTTVQIVAIVLSIIVAVAGFAIFASIYLTKKNADENKKDEQKRR